MDFSDLVADSKAFAILALYLCLYITWVGIVQGLGVGMIVGGYLVGACALAIGYGYSD